ncbi:MAG: P-type conjugative transfer protein TrbJ [Campylobacterales bacterium]|nr:P-type conjugative transfer protein TrbJ [Campylobacterales bacterium]
MKYTKSAILALLIIAPVNTFSSSIVGSTEMTQIRNNLELVAQYAKQLEQYEVQLKTLTENIQRTKYMAQNLVQLPAATWQRFQQDAIALKNVVQQGQGISFAAANLDTQFANTYKGYSSYEASAAQSLDSRNRTFADQYRNLNASTRDTVNGSLRSLNTQMNSMSSDDAVLATLQQQSRSADGQLKAIQAASEIAVNQTDTLNKLRWTLMTQASTQAAYMAAQNDKETAQRALSERRNTLPLQNKSDRPNINNFLKNK